MNKRMREPFYTLMWKASIGYNDSWSQIDPEVLEKFAELIVRECSKYIEDKFDFCGDEIIIAEKLREHFGVEE